MWSSLGRGGLLTFPSVDILNELVGESVVVLVCARIGCDLVQVEKTPPLRP